MANLDTPSNTTNTTERFVCISEASRVPSPGLDDSATSRTSWNEPDDPEIKASWKSMFAFTTRRHLRVFIPAWILSTLAGAIKSTISIFLGFIFDNIADYVAGSIDRSGLTKSVSKWCTILTGLGVSSWLLNGGLFALWLVFGELQAKDARERLFTGLLRRDMEWYDLQRDGVSSLLVRIQTQVRELQVANSQPLGFFLQNIASGLAAIGIALYYSWKLTLVLSTTVPIAILVLWLISRRLQPAIDAQKRELNEASKYANTAINAVDTVKVFNGQDYEVWQYTSAIKTAAQSYLIQANANALQMGVTRFLLVAMFVAGFWYGLVLYKEGGLSPGNVLTTFYSFLMANQAVGSLLPQWLILSKGMSAGKTLKQIMGEMKDKQRRVSKFTGSRQLESFDGDIEVVNLSFAYPSNPKQPALVDVNFFFPAGETTFLFGRSGSGKSTLSNLLLKFYDPSSGMIIIDGHPIQTLDEKWLRDNITLVQQSSVLFNETLLQNITLGCKDGAQVSKEDVRLACQAAMLIEVIHDLPDGLETVIGSGGDTMSGGQKQRVAIARARLRDTPILILDEATSALDHVNKGLVMEAIREWRKGKTTIIITHDPSQIYEADFVYVLDKGKIVEEGYRQALTKNPFSLFASLVSDNNGQKEESDPLSPIREDAASTTSGKARVSDDAPRYSVESLASDTTVEYGTANTELVKKLRRFSSFLYNPNSTQQAHHQNKRMSLGMASAYTNTLRSDADLRRSATQPSRPNRGSIHLQKPLPSLPSPGDIRSLRPLSLYPQIGVQEYEMAGTAAYNTTPSRGYSTVNRAGTAREHYYRKGRSKSELNTEYVALVSGKLSTRKQKKGQKQTEEASLKTILSTVWPNLTRKDRIMLVFGFGFAFINAGCTPAFSYVLAKLFNSFYITENQDAEARKWALIIFGIASVDGSSSYFFHYFLEYSGRVWVDALRGEALKRILAQPRSWFDNDANSPNLLNDCLDRNAEEMRNLLGRFAGYAFVAASMIMICVIWAFIVCWKLTAVSLASVPVIYAITRAFETVSGKWERKTDTQASVIGGIFTETFSNIRVVRALTLESYFQRKHSNAVDAAYRTGVRRGTFSGIFFGISDSTGLFVTTLILYYGAILVGEGSFTFDNVVASITLLLFGIGNAKDTLAFIPQITSSRTTATQMLRLASLPLAAESPPGARAIDSPLPIRMHNLCFSYPAHPNLRILRNLSLTFNANTHTAIVGPSGSGKSTIAALFLGLYPPSPTPVYPITPPLTFNHQSLSQLSLPALRAHMALVPQFPAIFPATITQNIAYGLTASSALTSPANVEAAARAAGIHDFVASLPHGYATRVGEGGQALSGGQQMRVAIARALVRRPRVLVLDEPTAALDRESADAVGEAVKRVVTEGRGVAVVVITHDLRMMREAGRVVVVEKGVVVEEGSWEELRWAGGSFERLVGGGEVRET